MVGLGQDKVLGLGLHPRDKVLGLGTMKGYVFWDWDWVQDLAKIISTFQKIYGPSCRSYSTGQSWTVRSIY